MWTRWSARAAVAVFISAGMLQPPSAVPDNVLHAMQPTRVPTLVWAPNPATLRPYPAGQAPWVKLSDLNARHRGDSPWQERVVDDGRLRAEYESAVPGTTLRDRFHPDTRVYFAVLAGQLRVSIEGQPAFIATRGSLVNIPRQTLYSLATVGDTPSLRWTVHVANATTLFTQSETPPSAPANTTWTAATINRTPGVYDEWNQPHLNVPAAAAADPKYAGGRFVRGDKSEMLVIYGHEKNQPPLDPRDRGHFHAESAEFWLVLSGRIRYAIEGLEPFVASVGDTVYVPATRWHATRFVGEDACRLSVTEYVGNALLLPPPPLR